MTYDPGKCDRCGRALTKKERLYGLCRICAEAVRAGVLYAAPGQPEIRSTVGPIGRGGPRRCCIFTNITNTPLKRLRNDL